MKRLISIGLISFIFIITGCAIGQQKPEFICERYNITQEQFNKDNFECITMSKNYANTRISPMMSQQTDMAGGLAVALMSGITYNKESSKYYKSCMELKGYIVRDNK